MKLTLHGTEFTPRAEAKIQLKGYLDKLPNGVVMTTTELGVALQCSPSGVRNQSTHLPDYCELVGRRQLLWGNKETAKELHRRLNAANAG